MIETKIETKNSGIIAIDIHAMRKVNLDSNATKCLEKPWQFSFLESVCIQYEKTIGCPITIGNPDENISHQAGSDTSILFLCIHNKHICCHFMLSFHATVCLPQTTSNHFILFA